MVLMKFIVKGGEISNTYSHHIFFTQISIVFLDLWLIFSLFSLLSFQNSGNLKVK